MINRLKQPEEETDPESGSEVVGGGLNSAMLYDLLLGLGYRVEAGISNSGGVTLLEDGQSETEVNESGDKSGKNPTLTLTTCYSPVSSSVQSSSRGENGTPGGLNSNIFFVGDNFPPYSVFLAVTIAIGE